MVRKAAKILNQKNSSREAEPKGRRRETNVEHARRKRRRLSAADGGRRQKTGGRKKLLAAVCAAVLVLGAVFACWRFWRSDFVQMRYVYMWEHQQEILLYSERNNIDPFLVAAIIKNESGFDHKAVSDAGAVGLMQIMPDTGRWIAGQMGLKDYQDSDLYKSAVNIRMGCWYVGELEHEFKRNLVLLLVAYNAGRGQTRAWMLNNGWDYDFNDAAAIPYPDTREYVEQVLRDRDRYYLYYKDRMAAPRETDAEQQKR